MKMLKNLDLRLKPFVLEGEPTQAQLESEPTFRRVYRAALALGKGTPEQALDATDLLDKVTKCPEQIELTDSEFSLLKERVKQNPLGYVDYFLGQALRNLED